MSPSRRIVARAERSVRDERLPIGRVTADSVMDFIRASSENNVLGLAFFLFLGLA